jgi:hypothetical protein
MSVFMKLDMSLHFIIIPNATTQVIQEVCVSNPQRFVVFVNLENIALAPKTYRDATVHIALDAKINASVWSDGLNMADMLLYI